MSSDGDVRALNRKIDAMWALGVRAFQLQFQDVSYSEWHCDQDAETFGSGPEAAARAQARVANAVARHLADRHPGAEPLSVMPTEYYQDGATDYRRRSPRRWTTGCRWPGPASASSRGPSPGVSWRAPGRPSAAPLVTMDNYPVNDYAQDRIFLGPYTGRDPAVAAGSAALLANAMEQPSASRIPLFTAADFAWNPKGYRPAGVLAGGPRRPGGRGRRARAALRRPGGQRAPPRCSAATSPRTSGRCWPRSGRPRARPRTRARRETAARELRAAFGVMRQAPERLERDRGRPAAGRGARRGRRSWPGTAGRVSSPWTCCSRRQRGDGAAAWRAAAGPDRCARRSGRARRRSARASWTRSWTGSTRRPTPGTAPTATRATATRDAHGYTVRLDRARPLEAVTTLTRPGDAAGDAVLEAHVPGEGWRRLGPLSATGWTQTAAKGLRADALRVTAPSARPVLVGPPAPGRRTCPAPAGPRGAGTRPLVRRRARGPARASSATGRTP